MIYLEIAMGIAFLALCLLSARSDCTTGLIRNRLLLVFLITSVVLDCLYYGLFVSDIFIEFLINVGVIIIVSLFLFFTHSFAGGDCKLSIVFALLYPARFYCVYAMSNITLIFALGIAILFGYLYLLFESVWRLLTKKSRISYQYIKSYLSTFAISFLSATIYVSLFMLCVILIGKYGFLLNEWLVRGICLFIAWAIGRFPFFRKWIIVSIAAVLAITLCVVLRIIPFSANFENYLFVLALLLCQMTIKSNLYYNIAVKDVKKGMILSTGSSVMMQGSRVRGLPPVSSEDLRDRLSQEQVDSVMRWSKSRSIETLTVVKKIPFAVFLSLGFIAYFIIWSVV